MSSHFLLQHVQIFLAKNARRQPTGMTEKRLILGGTVTLPSIYAMNQQKPKQFLHHSFTSQMWNTNHQICTSEGNPTPPLPTISVACSAAPLHYIHRGLGLKLILQGCTWKFLFFPRFLQQLPAAFRQKPVSAEKEKHKFSFLREGEREGKDWDYLLRRCWLLHLLLQWKSASKRGRGIHVSKSNHHPCHSTWTDVKKYLGN